MLFEWRSFRLPGSTVGNLSIERTMGDRSLLSLPLCMQFEIVIHPGAEWFSKDVLEGWLDVFCPDQQLRGWITVRENERYHSEPVWIV